MKKVVITLVFAMSSFPAPLVAGEFEWTSGWGMGVIEYHVSDGNKNEVIISCPDDEYSGHITADAMIDGEWHSSKDHGAGGFDVIVDGEMFSNPFFTDCRVCSENFRVFWDKFIDANNLMISYNGKAARLPTNKINQLLSPLGSEMNSCSPAW